MKASFNIKVGYGKKEVTLNILQTRENHFEVIYFGGVMGAVRFNSQEWELIEIEQLEPGDLPFYQPELKGERLKVILNQATVEAIGEEIENYLSHQDTA